MRGWVRDVVLGVRLALGGGRMSRVGVVRLVMSTIGIGLATAVLLTAAAIPNAVDSRDARTEARFIQPQPVSGVDPLLMVYSDTVFDGERVSGSYLKATGPTSPLPPGIDHVPAEGELLVSPAMRDLLTSEDGAKLAARFPDQRVTGTIGQDGVVDPHELTFYAGGDLQPGKDFVRSVYGFSGHQPSAELPIGLLILLLLGVVAILTPVLIFVVTSSRIAGAERDRRLAALRLVGASRRQVIRLSAAESLVSAATGLVVGACLFLLVRSVAENVEFAGAGLYSSDLTLTWPLALTVVLLVPGLAVMASLFALRRTIIEPLGVVRQAKPVRRRLLWRVIPFALGAALLFLHVPLEGERSGSMVVPGAALLLIGIPVLLPALLERAVSRFRGGKPALQLAMRRLQLDSGTAARVVGGVAVVLAGAIAVQTVLTAEAAEFGPSSFSERAADSPVVDGMVNVSTDIDKDVLTTVRGVAGVQSAQLSRRFSAVGAGDHEYYTAAVVDCETLRATRGVTECADGDVFATSVPGTSEQEVRAGAKLAITDYRTGVASTPIDWTLPPTVRPISESSGGPLGHESIIATPGALPPGDLGLAGVISVSADTRSPEVLDRIRDAIGPFRWKASVYFLNTSTNSEGQSAFTAIRNGLLGGSAFTLLLAAVSLLVVALEQVRERRRPIAALSASGVPFAVLARSMLWQNVVPVLLGIGVAVVTGLGLAASMFSMIGDPFQVDWLTVGLLSGAAALVVVFVTGLTMPSLCNATRLESLRTE